MRNEGVLLELSGPVRTTSEKISSIKTIRSSKSCLAFGLYHVESWGRHDGNVSHECRLNILLARHQVAQGNTFCVMDSKSNMVARSLKSD